MERVNRICFILCAGLWTSGCGLIYLDNVPEPNHDFASAAPLTPGVQVKGRVKALKRKPAFLKINSEAGKTVVFRAQDRREYFSSRCTKFTVFGPNQEILYEDWEVGRNCNVARERPDLPNIKVKKVEGVVIKEIDYGLELRVPARTAGTYFLRIDKRTYSSAAPWANTWHYKLTATIE
ncbi:MAG: hypothetical protein HY922_14280 [Elusimicrobia bacterium]|nr:hypothetical protein [Elusimicrobiota bacterium]